LTNSFEELGGEESWGKIGCMKTFLASSGISATDMKPLFAMEAWTGSDMQLFEAGSPTEFYFHNPIDDSIHRITGLDTLEKIVDWLNDEDKGGYSSILTEQVV
jgi:hypothetical protein